MAKSSVRFTIMMSAEYRRALDEIRDFGEYPNDSAMFDAAMMLLAKKLKADLPPRVHPVGYNARPEKSDLGT